MQDTAKFRIKYLFTTPEKILTMSCQVLSRQGGLEPRKIFLKKFIYTLAQSINKISRYTHCSIIMEKKLYIIGGRTLGNDFDSLLSHCEQLDLRTMTWKLIAPMQKRRSTCFAIVYKA